MLHSGHCHVVALCDIDLKGKHTLSSRHIHGVTPIPPEGTDTKERKPVKFLHKARAFTDFRKMFDEMADEIDAVLIATPDHSHFAIAMLAMSLGKHVYVEKPLAHTFGQCSRLMDLAKRSGVVTQMGNQGHSGANYFQFKAWMNTPQTLNPKESPGMSGQQQLRCLHLVRGYTPRSGVAGMIMVAGHSVTGGRTSSILLTVFWI